MVRLREKGLLLYIIDNCVKIEETTKNMTKESFCENDMAQSATSLDVIKIYEYGKKLPLKFLRIHNQKMPWSRLKKLRKEIEKDFFKVKYEVMWEILVEDVPKLHQYCANLIDNNQ